MTKDYRNPAGETPADVANFLLADLRVALRGNPGGQLLCDSLQQGIIAAVTEAVDHHRGADSGILQEWVAGLGLRHQGVLLSAVRGCDTAAKQDPSKLLARCLRAAILRAHCGDAARAKTFIEQVGGDELWLRMAAFLRSADQYPHHYVMHLVHAAEVVGYKHPDEDVAFYWRTFYFAACRGLHVTPETEAELDARLDADEEDFAHGQQESVKL